MTISDYINNFFYEIKDVNINIPLNIKLYIIFIFIFIIIQLYFIFIGKLYVTTKYIKWGFIFIIINLINIISIIYLYLKKKGKFIGPVGEIGYMGDKGNEGTNITCKLCDYNIYLQKTKIYSYRGHIHDNILKLLFNNDYNLNKLMIIFNDSDTDVDRLIKDVYNNNLNNNFNGLVKLIDMGRFILIKDINYTLNEGNNNYTIKRPVGPYGFNALSDVLIPYNSNIYSYTVTGDYRYPLSFNKITTIILMKNKEPIYYDILKPVAPNGYKSIGLAFFKIYDNARDITQYACLNEKCIKKADKQDLIFKYIYPDTQNGFVSLWMSHFNTIHINYSSYDDIVDKKRLIEIIYNYDDEIYYASGTIKRTIYKNTQDFFDNIKLNKLTIFCYIFASYINDLNYYYNKFKKKFKKSLGLNLGIFETQKINISNVNDILDNINKELIRIEKKYNNELSKKANSTITLDNIISQYTKDKGKLIYKAKKIHKFMQSNLNFIPTYIENTNTIFQLINKIFRDGLYTKINKNNININKKSFILLLKCLIPPNNGIYIPKNSCLVYNKINEKRLILLSETMNIIKNYNILLNKLNNSGEDFCSNNDRAKILNYQENISDILDENLSNIIDYPDKIISNDFKEFTNNQINIVKNQYIYITNFMNNTCSL